MRFRREGRRSSETFYDRHDADQFCRLMSVMSPEVALEHMQRQRIESTHLPTLNEWSARYIDHLTGITSGTRLNYARVYARTFGPLIGELPSLPVMQARLGHESIKTTVDVYGHLLPDLQRAAADAAHHVLGYAKDRALGATPD